MKSYLKISALRLSRVVVVPVFLSGLSGALAGSAAFAQELAPSSAGTVITVQESSNSNVAVSVAQEGDSVTVAVTHATPQGPKPDPRFEYGACNYPKTYFDGVYAHYNSMVEEFDQAQAFIKANSHVGPTGIQPNDPSLADQLNKALDIQKRLSAEMNQITKDRELAGDLSGKAKKKMKFLNRDGQVLTKMDDYKATLNEVLGTSESEAHCSEPGQQGSPQVAGHRDAGQASAGRS